MRRHGAKSDYSTLFKRIARFAIGLIDRLNLGLSRETGSTFRSATLPTVRTFGIRSSAGANFRPVSFPTGYTNRSFVYPVGTFAGQKVYPASAVALESVPDPSRSPGKCARQRSPRAKKCTQPLGPKKADQAPN